MKRAILSTLLRGRNGHALLRPSTGSTLAPSHSNYSALPHAVASSQTLLAYQGKPFTPAQFQLSLLFKGMGQQQRSFATRGGGTDSEQVADSGFPSRWEQQRYQGSPQRDYQQGPWQQRDYQSQLGSGGGGGGGFQPQEMFQSQFRRRGPRQPLSFVQDSPPQPPPQAMKVSKTHGVAYVHSTFSNTFVTVTDSKGNKKAGASSGCLSGVRGSGRRSKYAAQAVAEQVAQASIKLKINSVEVRIQGCSIAKKRFALMGLKDGGLLITKIRDVTSVPHNGCRPPKKRRI